MKHLINYIIFCGILLLLATFLPETFVIADGGTLLLTALCLLVSNLIVAWVITILFLGLIYESFQKDNAILFVIRIGIGFASGFLVSLVGVMITEALIGGFVIARWAGYLILSLMLTLFSWPGKKKRQNLLSEETYLSIQLPGMEKPKTWGYKKEKKEDIQ